MAMQFPVYFDERMFFFDERKQKEADFSTSLQPNPN